jgi:hypothetical protein
MKRSALPPDQRLEAEKNPIIFQREEAVKSLQAASLLCHLLSELVAKNDNVYLRQSIHRHEMILPHVDTAEGMIYYGRMYADIGLRIENAVLHFPGEGFRNRFLVGSMTSERDEVIRMGLFEFNTFCDPRGMLFNPIIHKCPPTFEDVKLPGVPSEEVEVIFDQVIADIKDIFRDHLSNTF